VEEFNVQRAAARARVEVDKMQNFRPTSYIHDEVECYYNNPHQAQQAIREATAEYMRNLKTKLALENLDPIADALQKYMQRKLQIGMITEIKEKSCSCAMNTLLRDGCQCGGV